MANQDEAQIVADQRAFNQYFEWFMKPKIDRYRQAEAA